MGIGIRGIGYHMCIGNCEGPTPTNTPSYSRSPTPLPSGTPTPRPKLTY
jgi:hypothetical protein